MMRNLKLAAWNMEYNKNTILGPEVFLIYMLTLQDMLNYYSVSCHFYADDIQIYFKLDSKDQCVSKLNAVFYAVKAWMFKGKRMLNKEETNRMVVESFCQIRNIDLPSNLRLDQSSIGL